MAYINGQEVLFSAEVDGLGVIDAELNAESENPVQNKAIVAGIEKATSNVGHTHYNDLSFNNVILSKLTSNTNGKIVEAILTKNTTYDNFGFAIKCKEALKENTNYRLCVEIPDDITKVEFFLTNNASVWGNASGLTRNITNKIKIGNIQIFDFNFTGTIPSYIIVRIFTTTETALNIKTSLAVNEFIINNYPNNIAEESNGIYCYHSFPEVHGLLTNDCSVNYPMGNYKPQVIATPTNEYFAISCKTNLKVNTHYKLLVEVKGNAKMHALIYRSADSWGTGDQAPYGGYTFIDRGNGLFEVDFIISSNDVNAKYLLLRFRDTTLSENNIKFSLIEQFYFDYSTKTQYIAFIGDSLTAQDYAGYIDVGNYVKQNFAVGGENIKSIFARCGVEPLKVLNTEITNGANTLTISHPYLFGQGMGNINPVTIAGIKGNLSLDSGNYIFTTLDNIETTPIFEPCIIPYQSTLNIVQYVFWIGTNNTNSNTTENIDYIYNSWLKALSVYPNSIIVGLTIDSTDEKLSITQSLNEKGNEGIGARFIDVHDWLVNNGLNYCGLTATETDETYINAGKIPPSLLSDAVHFNEYGKRCVAHLVQERLELLNILE